MLITALPTGANLESLRNAFERLGYVLNISNQPEDLLASDLVILPGVGHAAPAMAEIRKRGLDKVIRNLSQPVLGICLGMQLFFERHEEGGCEGLGIIPGAVTKMNAKRLPHMGWNSLIYASTNVDSKGCDDDRYYFVHSYAAPDGPWVRAYAEHEQRIPAVVRHRNFTGVQFHPEKSGAVGQRFLEDYLQEINYDGAKALDSFDRPL